MTASVEIIGHHPRLGPGVAPFCQTGGRIAMPRLSIRQQPVSESLVADEGSEHTDGDAWLVANTTRIRRLTGLTASEEP